MNTENHHQKLKRKPRRSPEGPPQGNFVKEHKLIRFFIYHKSYHYIPKGLSYIGDLKNQITKANHTKTNDHKEKETKGQQKSRESIKSDSDILAVCRLNFEQPYLPVYLPKMAPTRPVGNLRKSCFQLLLLEPHCFSHLKAMPRLRGNMQTVTPESTLRKFSRFSPSPWHLA